MLVPSLLLSVLPLASCFPSLSKISADAKAPYFVLAGDSTTAVQSSGGGGWGNGFLAVLTGGASGVNLGHNGATTVSFVSGGDWNKTLTDVRDHAAQYDCYVTIQFGHNDQKSSSGITTAEYETNLENMAKDVKMAGGTPIIVTPLSRRNYDSSNPPKIKQDLETQRQLSIQAAKSTQSQYIDLNIASVNYLNAIGPDNANTYNLHGTDHTHLNTQGSDVFGYIVADLIVDSSTGVYPALSKYFKLDSTVVYDVTHGVYWIPPTCSGSFCGSA